LNVIPHLKGESRGASPFGGVWGRAPVLSPSMIHT
jgi:hypothetical protein